MDPLALLLEIVRGIDWVNPISVFASGMLTGLALYRLLGAEQIRKLKLANDEKECQAAERAAAIAEHDAHRAEAVSAAMEALAQHPDRRGVMVNLRTGEWLCANCARHGRRVLLPKAPDRGADGHLCPYCHRSC